MKLLRSAVLLLAGFVVQTTTLAADARLFRAGAHAQDITPALPISLNGGLSDRAAKAVHDPLHARCLVLDDGTTKIAFAVCDSCMIPRDIYDAAKEIIAKKTGIPTANMLMSATHTHTAPTASGVFQSDPDENYRKLLVERIAAGVIKAHDNLEPAKIGWAVGEDATQVFNRRWLTKEGVTLPDPFGVVRDKVKMNPGLGNPSIGKPIGITDPAVSILSVQSRTGRPIALLANYSLHYVGGVPGDQVSADYFAQFAKRIGELVEGEGQGPRAEGQGERRAENAAKSDPSALGPSSPGPSVPPFVGIMSNGTSGDINNVNFALRAFPPRKPGEQMIIVAESVAQAAMKAYRTIEHRDWVELKAAEKEILLHVRKPVDTDVRAAKELLEKAKAKGPVLSTLPDIYARETVLLAEYPDAMMVKIQALRVGEVGIAAIPCEVFVEVGLAIRKASPLKPTFTISLANGYNGYLPTPQHHELGGYETWRARSSYLEEKASVKIEATIAELFEKVKP